MSQAGAHRPAGSHSVCLDEWVCPNAFTWIEVVALIFGAGGQSPSRDGTNFGRIRENLLHARVRFELIALPDADGGEQSTNFRVKPFGLVLPGFVR